MVLSASKREGEREREKESKQERGAENNVPFGTSFICGHSSH